MSAVDIRDAFFDEFYRVGSKDPDVVFLSSDMDAFSLRKFKNDFPNRFINVGVAEQNMVNVASGLALSGKKVFCYGIAAFVTLRCFEQIKINLCSLNLPVTIIGAGAGFSFGYDGPTHHGLIDMATMRLLPEMTVYNLSSSDLAKASVEVVQRSKTPTYIRLDKGKFPSMDLTEKDLERGYRILRPLLATNLVATGFMTAKVLEVADTLKARGCAVGVVDLFRVKPLSPEFGDEVLKCSKQIVSIEENSIVGGLGSILSEAIVDSRSGCLLARVAAPDKQFIQYGDREWFHKVYGLDAASICQKVKQVVDAI